VIFFIKCHHITCWLQLRIAKKGSYMRRKEIEETLSAVANRLYRIGENESAHHSTTTSTETVCEEIQRLSFLIDKCVAALKIKEGDSQQTTNNARDETVRSCTNCGNEHCSMHAGMCSKWVQVKRTASPVA
jgi:hypothetical protein